jgi:hypothetical protein
MVRRYWRRPLFLGNLARMLVAHIYCAYNDAETRIRIEEQ